MKQYIAILWVCSLFISVHLSAQVPANSENANPVSFGGTITAGIDFYNTNSTLERRDNFNYRITGNPTLKLGQIQYSIWLFSWKITRISLSRLLINWGLVLILAGARSILDIEM